VICKTFSQYNFEIINFTEIIKGDVCVDIINHLHTYHLLRTKNISPDVKKFFYHHIVSEICVIFTEKKSTEKKILYFNPFELKQIELFDYFPKFKTIQEIVKIIKKVKNVLPIKIYCSKFTFTELIHHIEKQTGEGKDLTNKLTILSREFDDYYTFAKVLKFTLNNNLTLLQHQLNSNSRNNLLVN
jgi:hypothetical protein